MQATTLQGGETGISEEAIGALREAVAGDVVEPSDPGYSEVREVFNAMNDAAPALAVRCTRTDDVLAAVNLAREEGLLLAVRGGGHSVAGLSAAEGCVLIDLSPMDAVEVDPDARRVRAGGGALWKDVDAATQQHGLVAPGGVVSDTGIAGLTLGGGYGWVRRKYGLSCDHLVEAEVVCADGEVRTASKSENEDLFWALRGGGGNFGVVTSFTFDLNPLGPEVAFSACFYPIEEIEQVLRGFREFTADAADEVTSVIVTLTFPANPEMPEAVHDREVAIVGAVYAGDPEEGMEVTKPLRELGTVLFDMSGPTPFTDVQQGFDPLFPRNTLHSYWKSQYVEELSDELIEVIVARAQDRPAPLTLFNTFHMGGAIAAVDPEETAFSERAAPYMISIDGMWDDEAMTRDCIAWVREAWEQVREFGTGGVYLNFTGLSDEAMSAGVDTAFGRNLERLAQIKSKYDPDNLFRVNNNILPA